MDKKLKDILSNLNPDVDQETLMAYLQGQLQAEQRHEVERQLAGNDFDSDAMDGLQELQDKKKISSIVEQLNRDLKKKTERKKQRRKKLELPNQNWLWISAMILLLLIVFSYLIIHKMRNP
ncbi:MAG: hypothetical protein EOO09_19865 [Chitinophagaceae bacterium]|nr:MAG: hypothetical protein EOO09_19865 [Chitinophagaceae bacterium]